MKPTGATAESSRPAPSNPKSPPRRGPVLVKSVQPARDELKALGVKCRDFAYESTLPPIRPYVRRQFQPDVEKQPTEAEGSTTDRPMKRRRISRELTEPALDSMLTTKDNPMPGRTHALADLSQFNVPFTPLRIMTDTQQSSGIESDITTPLVTPRGTLHWPSRDQDAIPAPRFTPPTLSCSRSIPSNAEACSSRITCAPTPRIPSLNTHSTLAAFIPVKLPPSLSFSSSLSSLTSSAPSRHHTPAPRYFLRSRVRPRPGPSPVTLPPPSRVKKPKKPLPLPSLRKRRTGSLRTKK